MLRGKDERPYGNNRAAVSLDTNALYNYWFQRHILMSGHIAGANLGNRVNNVHSVNHLAEHTIPEALWRTVAMIQKGIIF